jgi:hypothetical protein
MREALDDLIRRNPGVRPEKLVSAHIEGDNGEGVRGSAAFLDLARDPELVELVSGVIGDDVILWGCHVFCKPAGDGYETPWHQDGHYWPIRPLANCTVWVALEDSDRGNGCLRVIPGSHRQRRCTSTCTKTAPTSRCSSAWRRARSTRPRPPTSNSRPARCRCTTST